MLRPVAAGFALALILAPAALANPNNTDPAKVPAGAYALDGRHASLFVRVPHMGGFSHFVFRFDKLDGGFTYDPANWGATKVAITIDPASIASNLPDFDKTIAGPDYLNAKKFPAITFTSSKVEAGADGKGTVSGDLTFLGVTKPVVLDVTFNGSGPGLLGAGTRMGFSGTTRIKRSDFGLTTMHEMAGDDLDLVFDVEFVKK